MWDFEKETRRMEWDNASAAAAAGVGGERHQELGEGEGFLCVKVMTDEQMEALRRQIAVYAAICEQLGQMHNAATAHQDSLAGMKLGGLYSDALITSRNHKINTRQRWTPTSMQIQILENTFNQGSGTPNKQKIKEITLELLQHGRISESNVYNWFQNRRARSKRKQIALSNTESEAEADEDPPNEKRPKSNECHPENLPISIDDHTIYDVQMYSETQSLEQMLSQAQGMQSPNDNANQISSYENVLSASRFDHIMGKFDLPSFSPCCPGESYDIMR